MQTGRVLKNKNSRPLGIVFMPKLLSAYCLGKYPKLSSTVLLPTKLGFSVGTEMVCEVLD